MRALAPAIQLHDCVIHVNQKLTLCVIEVSNLKLCLSSMSEIQRELSFVGVVEGRGVVHAVWSIIQTTCL